jgi:hypothetical protein
MTGVIEMRIKLSIATYMLMAGVLVLSWAIDFIGMHFPV